MFEQIKRGEIYWVDLGNRNGSIQGGKRPVVVISNPLNNKFSPTINVLPITSQSKAIIPVHVSIGQECGLATKSIVLTEQMSTINKTQLLKKVGECTKGIMREIAIAIIKQTYLEEDLAM